DDHAVRRPRRRPRVRRRGVRDPRHRARGAATARPLRGPRRPLRGRRLPGCDHGAMSVDFSDLPVPVDDGAADHLSGLTVPSVSLPSTLGGDIDLADAAHSLLVVYVYPRTGTPGEPPPPGWDDIPGARGCTPESCAFRDARSDLATRGASLIGISTQ